MRIALSDGWTLRTIGGHVQVAVAGVEVPASVLGSGHTDLLAAGLIPDRYLERPPRGGEHASGDVRLADE